MDNDVVGKRMEVFSALLNLLINLSEELATSFSLHADVLHLGFNKELIRKMSLAGFKSVQIGYEGITDSMLKKLKKSTTFAENLLFVKFSQQYDIELTITGLIIGLPNEEEEDILESCNNLHYLRFYLDEKSNRGLRHNFAELMLFYDTPFWNMMTDDERMEFNEHPTIRLLPEDFIPFNDELYSIFGQIKKQPSLMVNWRKFEAISKYYEKNSFKYYLMKNGDNVHYIEYKNNLKIEDITFDDIVYLEVMKIANDKVVSLNKIFEKIQDINKSLSKKEVLSIVKELDDKFLLYCNQGLFKNNYNH